MNEQYYSPQRFSILPTVVKNLLIINALFFLATLAFNNFLGIDLYKYLSLYFYKSENFHLYQYITYMFMHSTGNFGHILFNMFALWMFGSTIENQWGSKKFLFYYLLTGIGAGITHTAVMAIDYYSIASVINLYAENPTVDTFFALISNEFKGVYNPEFLNEFIRNWRISPYDRSFVSQSMEIAESLLAAKANVPTVGASGSVYGLLLAFGMMFPNALIYVYFLFPLKAKWFVIIFGAAELYLGIRGTNDGVAHFAHLGGMIFGLILILMWKKRNRNYYQY